jgi:hypothetical protein
MPTHLHDVNGGEQWAIVAAPVGVRPPFVDGGEPDRRFREISRPLFLWEIGPRIPRLLSHSVNNRL